MGWTTVFGRRWWVLAVVLVLGIAQAAPAIYLDQNDQISLRARIYNQASVRMEGSYDNTTPTVKAGQLVQSRTFFNPELEAKLESYTSWMDDSPVLRLIKPDALRFRLAAWGFYDGIYDYGTGQFHDQLTRTKAQFYRFSDTNDILRGAEQSNPRDIFGNDRRVNELYLNYVKGPFFLRIGKQAISWGESDTVALLDQNNPFDLTLGAPGIFEDVDEARIPLWTIRTSYNLFNSWGPLSSAFVEAYWVPGGIDTTTPTVPLPTLGPYVVPGTDPRTNPLLSTLIGSQGIVALVDQTRPATMANSRYGFRVEAVVLRDYTVSAWFYKTFNQSPVPLINSLVCSDGSQSLICPKKILAIDLVHQGVPVVGLGNTFYFAPLDGIVRMEVEYFNHEPGFIPSKNLLIPELNSNYPNGGPKLLGCGPSGLETCKSFMPRGSVPHADFLRWELGFDRFFFFRPLNPSNSFTWVTALVGSYNMSETSQKDFYYYGQQKPGTYQIAQPQPADFVQLQKVEMFMQTHLESDYWHGRLTPQLTFIQNLRGTFAIIPKVTYRYSDSLLFDVSYINIGGMFQQLGFFRDRDQLAVRATYQLN